MAVSLIKVVVAAPIQTWIKSKSKGTQTLTVGAERSHLLDQMVLASARPDQEPQPCHCASLASLPHNPEVHLQTRCNALLSVLLSVSN